MNKSHHKIQRLQLHRLDFKWTAKLELISRIQAQQSVWRQQQQQHYNSTTENVINEMNEICILIECHSLLLAIFSFVFFFPHSGMDVAKRNVQSFYNWKNVPLVITNNISNALNGLPLAIDSMHVCRVRKAEKKTIPWKILHSTIGQLPLLVIRLITEFDQNWSLLETAENLAVF